jgi:hypothetical protein
MLFSGMVATSAGLAVVLAHNIWNGGALPVVVTLVGWAVEVQKGWRRSTLEAAPLPLSRPSVLTTAAADRFTTRA